MRFVVEALLAVAVAMGAPAQNAYAQSAEPQLSVEQSARRVEVGEPFTVRLKVSVERNVSTPSDPQLRGLPREIRSASPTIGTETSMQIVNGQVSATVGISVTWQLVADKPGHYRIPSPSVVWNGSRLQGSALTVDVTPATGRPRSQPQSGGSLLPGGLMGAFPFGIGRRRNLPDLLDEMEGSEAMDAGELGMDRAPDAQVFLRAIADKQAAVVGEQVTVSFYCYRRVEIRPVADRKPTLTEFVRVPLVQEPNTSEIRAMVGGKRYLVSLVDRVALFPLHSGDLHTGPLTWVFDGGRERVSNDLVVHVTEPPLARRPPGYTLGDVGHFGLTAMVQPRRTEQGGSISVTLKVAGRGNPPPALKVPARTGIEWLDPEKRESVEPRGNVVQGWRSFGYVVRIHESGSVPLGKVELPFWDPVGNKYAIASVALGSVEVTPTTATASAPEAKTGAFATLPKPRLALGAYTRPALPLLDGMRFWWLLALPPFAVGLYAAGARGALALRSRREAKKTSTATRLAAALADAAKAEASGDAQGLAAAIERALYHAVEGSTGLRARGVLLDELGIALTDRGLDAKLVAAVVEALRSCESVRFDPTATASSLAELASTGRTLVRDLVRIEPTSKAKSA